MAKKTYCNVRKAGQAENLDPLGVGPWGGEGYCKRHAGHGTDHLGQGRCKNHGGCTPTRSGKYSKITRANLKDLVDRFTNVADPLDMLDDLAMARAYLFKFVENYDEIVDSLLTWHDDYYFGVDEDGEPRTSNKPPPNLPSEAKVIMMLDTISKIVKRIQDVKSDQAIGRNDFLRIMTEMGRMAEHHTNPEQWAQIKSDWLSITLA